MSRSDPRLGAQHLSPQGHSTAGALYDGPLKTKLVPFNPLDPHTHSTLPPTFILALIAAIIGIPLYLLYNGALRSSGDKLEDKMKAPDTDGRGSFGDADDDDDDDGDPGKKKRKRMKDDPDEPSAILEVDDLKSLGGLVGFAAIVVLAFAIFPDELNGMIGSMSGGAMDLTSFSMSKSLLGGAVQEATHAQGRQEEVFTERTMREADGSTSGYTEKIVRNHAGGSSSPPPPSPPPSASGGLGGGSAKMADLLGGRSMIDLLILCKMDPDLCADMGLPFGAKKQETVVITETPTVDYLSSPTEQVEIVTEIMPDESYLSVLRSQPILLIELSEEEMSTHGLIILGISIIPILYGFGELAFQSGKTQETAKLADKRQAAEEKAYKDIKAYEASAARYKAQAEAMEKERREIEAIAEANHPTKPWRDAMRDRPWWAGPEWVPPEKPNDPDRWADKKIPEGMHTLTPFYNDAKGNRLKEFGLRHFRLGFNAEEAKKKGERYEADKARLAARWGESSESKSFKGPYKGFHPIFEDINHKGQEKPKSQEEILKALSENHVKAKVASVRARELRKARDDGKPANQRKGTPAVKKLSEVWDEEAKVEAEERYQSTLVNPVPSRRQLEDQKKQDEIYIDMAKKARAQAREAKEKQKAATPAPQPKTSFWRKKP